MPIEIQHFKEMDETLQGFIIQTGKQTMKEISKKRIKADTLFRIFNLGNPAIDLVRNGNTITWSISEESKDVMKILFRNHLFE
jgi:hypothetical protein